MKSWAARAKVASRLILRLLPIQVLLAAVGAVNGIVPSCSASSFGGLEAMSSVGLCAPISMRNGAY